MVGKDIRASLLLLSVYVRGICLPMPRDSQPAPHKLAQREYLEATFGQVCIFMLTFGTKVGLEAKDITLTLLWPKNAYVLGLQDCGPPLVVYYSC